MIDHHYTNHNLSDHAVALGEAIRGRHGNSAFRVGEFSYSADLVDELINGGFLRPMGDGRVAHTGKLPIRVPGYVPPPMGVTINQ